MALHPRLTWLVSQIDGALHFVTPHSPSRRGSAGEQFTFWKIAHESDNAVPDFRRLLGMAQNRAANHLTNASVNPFDLAAHAEQTDFRIGARPIPHPEEIRVDFLFVLIQAKATVL
jgi:hypothetical protein